ncbi:MAG: hypothetical protein ACE5J3_14515 [Methanosarcinales archaeon]
MREEDLASKFKSSLEREVVKFLVATAMIKPLLDKIGVAEIVNSYTWLQEQSSSQSTF